MLPFLYPLPARMIASLSSQYLVAHRIECHRIDVRRRRAAVIAAARRRLGCALDPDMPASRSSRPAHRITACLLVVASRPLPHQGP